MRFATLSRICSIAERFKLLCIRQLSFSFLMLATFCHAGTVAAQDTLQNGPRAQVQGVRAQPAAAKRRAAEFLRGRALPTVQVGSAVARLPASRAAAEIDVPGSPAAALLRARAQHLAVLESQRVGPQAASLTTAWSPVGPLQVQTATYGLVTGRVTAVAIDSNDTSGNTVFVGTSGGGVWKSTNAAGAASAVSFAPLTDTLPVFAANSGGSAAPSLSIGAVSVQPGGTGVVLAGTGDPNDAADSYYGTGLLRSTDNGVTWSLVQGTTNGSFVGEGFAGFAWSSTSPQLVVAAVSSAAEAAVVGASKNPGVRGLYFSQDGGATWKVATIQDGSTVIQSQFSSFQNYRGNAATSVVWNPVRGRFYAAVRAHGYYESVDGITWTRLLAQPGSGLTTANCPSRPGNYGLTSCPIFRGALAAQPTSGDLFALTVDASNRDGGLWQDACAVSGGNCASGTVQWATQIDAAPLEDAGAVDAGDYNLSLAAVPAATAVSQTDTLLFVGTADLYRCSLAGGCSLRNTTNTSNGCSSPAGVAPAQHAIAWQLNLSNTSTPRVFVGNDGGLWRSLDGVRQQAAVCSVDDATHFDNLNGALGSLAQVSGFSSHPSDSNILLAALGANGSAASTTSSQANGTAAWSQLNAGESGTVAIDQSSGQTWLVQSGAGVSLHTCTRGTACTAADFAGPAAIGSAQVMSDGSLVDAPALLDPALNTNVIAGTCRVYRGPTGGGSAWSSSSAISRALAGPVSPACNSSDAYLRSLAAGGPAVITNGTQNSGSSVLYAGLAGVADGGSSFAGGLYVNTSANTATSSTVWTNVAGNRVTNDPSGFNAGGFDISSIAVDPSDSTGSTVYATIMGFGYPHVYRSTNAGGTWTNISSNLPDAPANSVVVDPNNPLTVYVALDTGVYVTTDVTTCVSAATGTTGSCWGVLGTALPNAPVLSLVASKGLSTSDGSGLLRAGTFGRGIWQMPLLSAGQSLAPVVTFSPGQLTFAAQNVGSTSNPQTVTVTNTGNAVLQISSVAASAGFAETDTCTNTSLTVNASCTLTVTFSPSAAGTASGSVSVYANVSGGYAALPLSGTGQGVSNLTLAPSSVVFPATAVGTSSPSQMVTVSNSGTAAASLSTPVSSPDFNLTASTCTATLPASGSCTVSVAFAPSQNAAEIGTVSISDGNANYVAQLRGTGTGSSNIALSPTAIDFGSAMVNGPLVGGTVTVTNAGNAVAYLGTPSATNDFSVFQNGCGSVLAAGSTCQIVVAFGAAAAGPRNGIFTISDTVAGDHTVALSGTGVASTVAFTPSSLVFATTNVGSASAAQRVTVTNQAGNAVAWGVLGATGDFGIAANTCVGSLNPGQTCTFDIVFTPTLDGARYGTVTLPDQYTTHQVQVSGNGRGTASVSVSATSLQFGSVAINSTSAAQTVTLTNSGTASATVSMPSLTGDYFLTGNTCTAALAPGGTCTVSVAFTPRAEGSLTGTLTLTDTSGTHMVALSGTGVGQPLVALSPSSLTFERTAIGGTSAVQTVTVSNGGSSSATLSAPTVTGDFALSANTCGAALLAGGNCTLSVVFKPASAGSRSGLLSLADASGNHTVALGGTGVGQPSVTVSPASLVFPQTAVFTTSITQTVTVANTGTSAATLSSTTITGDFQIATSTCTATLQAGASCTLAIDFAPQAPGSRTGTLTVTDAVGPHTVSISGVAQGQSVLTLSPASLSFSQMAVRSTSAAQTVFVVNGGTSVANLGVAVVTGDFAIAANTCGATLAAGDNCAVSLTFTPTTAGSRNGVLSVPDSSGNHTVALTGTGTTGVLTIAPAALTFPDTALGSTSGTRTVTLTNSGNAALRVLTSTTSGDFAVAGSCAGTTLAAGGTCTVSLTFTPTATGARTGTLAVTTDSSGSASSSVALSGTGTGAFTVVLTPTAVDFGTVAVGTSSAVRNITISNTGNVSGALGRISISGDYSLSANTCGASLPAQTGCTVSVVFKPSASGVRSGLLTVADDAGMQTATLTGTGTLPATDALAPLALQFGTQLVNTTSATQTVTLTNSGDVPLTLVSAVVLAGDFTAVNGCGPTLPAHTACNIVVAFAPKAVGTLTGTLQVTDVLRRQTVSLTGTGLAGPGVSLLPSSLSFANTGVGVVGAGQLLTLTNNGGSPVAISAVTVAGDFGIVSGGTSTCTLGASISVGSVCTLQIAFLPTAAGLRTGSVTILSNAPTQTAQLSGTGVDFQLLPNGPSTATTSSGSNAVFPLLLRPLVTTFDPVTYTCTGAPANTRCTVTSQYGDLSAVQTVSVTLLTGTTASRISLAWMLPLLGLASVGLRRKAWPGLLALCVCTALAAGLNGCGSGRRVAQSGDGTTTGGGTTLPTPAGTYNILVSATAAGVTHTVPLTLVVK
ncbi:MAG: choice-of-anchor D domain-containing protein [Janthinobacterium lividum]